MARKKHKQKGPAKPAPRYPHPKRPVNMFNAQQTPHAATLRFSLREEAQWASQHRTGAFDSAKKLRHMPITFVSAGLLQGTLEEKESPVEPTTPPSPSLDTTDLAQMTIRSSSPSPSVASASSASSEEVVIFRGRDRTPFTRTSLAASVAGTDTASRDMYGLQDTSSSGAPQHNGLAKSDERTSLPAPPVPQTLGGRSTHPLDGPASQRPLESVAEPVNLAFRPASLPAAAASSASGEPSIATKAAEPAKAPQAESDVDSDTNSIDDSVFGKRRGGKPIWEGARVDWVSRSKRGIGWLPPQARPDMDSFLRGEVDSRAGAMDDYAQNVEEFGMTDEMLASNFANREMDLDGGSHNDWEGSNPDHLQSVNVGGEEEEEDEENGEEELYGFDPAQLRSVDGYSTSTDIENIVARIINKRTRVTGAQYLVLYEGAIADDGHWLPATFLNTPSDLELIRRFEAKLPARQPPVSSSDIDSEFDEDEVDDDDDEDASELDDETIARVLQKQEELGLGSDELLLYAADEYFGGTVSGRRSAAPMTFDRSNQRRKNRSGGGRRTEPTFPSASAMADVLAMDPYNGFDIMDTNRPSLRPRKKGRRGQIPPELEDSDLTEQLQSAWEADRSKKRLKKAEREELRKQGLLGRRGKAPDLSVKYKEGFDVTEVTEEIREFLASSMQTLSLPPMEANHRAVMHQFCGQLGLHSKSRGDGANRFTVLSKTSRMPPFDDDIFDRIFDSKKFKYRWTNSARGMKLGSGKVPARPAHLRPHVGYKDGDVVGASAPELGPENRGRALMEKMGWSKGMALGAGDNKGILQPIAHVVKQNKAGLQ